MRSHYLDIAAPGRDMHFFRDRECLRPGFQGFRGKAAAPHGKSLASLVSSVETREISFFMVVELAYDRGAEMREKQRVK